jgi:hypothetical protein
MFWLAVALYGFFIVQICLARRVDIKDALILVLIPVLMSLPIFNYASTQSRLTSNSLLRYITIVFFLVPLAASRVGASKIKTTRWLRVCLLAAAAWGAAYSVKRTWTALSSYQLRGNAVHDGSYESTWTQRGYIDHSRQVRKIVQPGTVAVCAIIGATGRCSNGDIPGIFYRYYLSDLAVGGQIFGEDVFSVLSRTKADYLFVINPSLDSMTYLGTGNVHTALFRVTHAGAKPPSLQAIAN